MKITKTASGKTKIVLTKSEWKSIGKKAGWEQNVGNTFEGIGSGIAQGGNEKVQEYAKRIINGEPRDQVLQGIAPTMVKNVDQLVAQMKGQTAQQPQQQQSAPASGMTFTALMQDPSFQQTYQTIKKQRENEKRIISYWESIGIQFSTIPELVELLG